MKFKIGQKVRLRSGGPIMLVELSWPGKETIYTGTPFAYRCIWSNYTSSTNFNIFREETCHR